MMRSLDASPVPSGLQRRAIHTLNHAQSTQHVQSHSRGGASSQPHQQIPEKLLIVSRLQLDACSKCVRAFFFSSVALLLVYTNNLDGLIPGTSRSDPCDTVTRCRQCRRSRQLLEAGEGMASANKKKEKKEKKGKKCIHVRTT